MGLIHLLAIGTLCFGYACGASYSPSLDLKDVKQIQKATSQAMKNLMSYYRPSSTGVFDQAETPWHESGMIWGMHFDYAKWSGDTQFLNTVIGALVNASYTTSHDFLGGDQVTIVETLLGRWNDDILWPSQAVVAGAEVFGPKTIMPGSNGDYITLATKTFDQAAVQTDNKCGGGIYWSRDRGSPGGTYKSLITQLEFIAQGARNYIQTQNETALGITKQVLDWITSSGIGNPQTGVLFDGVGIEDCSKYTTNLWSYNYGQLLGALSWMHKATGEQKYLDMSIPYFDYAINTFANSNTSGVITEICEPNDSCNRDQQGFKAIFTRNLVYLYRETNNETIRNTIMNIVDTSLNAMVSRSCDKDWNCGGNWTTDTQPIKYVRSQHVSTALLVAAVGIHNSPESGLLPKLDGSSTSSQTGTSSNLTSSQTSKKAKSGALRPNRPNIYDSLIVILIFSLLNVLVLNTL